METPSDNLDSATFLQFAVKYSLLNEHQAREAMEEARTETGKQDPDLLVLMRQLERRGWLTNFQCSKLLKGDTDGYILGGYRLLYKISSGSFGRVYRAVEPESGRVVAVKVLRRRWSEDEQRIELFMREGRVGMSLQHPNIVEVLDIKQDPYSKQYFIIMEFVEGGNLREILQTRKLLTVPESLRILEDCAAGLAYAYSRGITHRDMKLTNVLVSSLGDAKLTDFGLAQMLAGAGGPEEDQVDRTVDYAGLERATNVRTGDVRSDIYFLGCVFSEMLTGRPPITTTRDKHQRMSRRRFEEVQMVRAGEIAASPAIFQLAETMMSLDPQGRYQTPSQMLDAVKAARREVTREPGKSASGTRSLFVAESDDRLQNTLREKFKELGFRVFMASDPSRALDRFRQQPYDALIVDVGTTGEEGLYVFQRVLQDAASKNIPCVGVAILSEDQADWASRLPNGPRARTLVRPVGLKLLHRTLMALLGKS
jgi:serine/threonine protein kinase